MPLRELRCNDDDPVTVGKQLPVVAILRGIGGLNIVAMDVNKDEQVTVQEILDYTRQVMRDADLDRDGVTTRQEFIAFVKRGQK